MLSILGRTQKLPKDLINVDFSNSWVSEHDAISHKRLVFPMAKREISILKKSFLFRDIFDRYSFGR